MDCNILKNSKKICIVGNIAGGKSTLAKKLSKELNIPVYHVDSYQYDLDFNVRSIPQVKSELQKIMSYETWLIDGFGPYDLLFERFDLSDQIIFIDLKLSTHVFRLIKRTALSFFVKRSELANHKSEFSVKHFKKLLSALLKVNQQMIPELRKIFSSARYKDKVIVLNM